MNTENMLIGIIVGIAIGYMLSKALPREQKSAETLPIINSESWKWIDYKGKE